MPNRAQPIYANFTHLRS